MPDAFTAHPFLNFISFNSHLNDSFPYTHARKVKQTEHINFIKQSIKRNTNFEIGTGI